MSEKFVTEYKEDLPLSSDDYSVSSSKEPLSENDDFTVFFEEDDLLSEDLPSVLEFSEDDEVEVDLDEVMDDNDSVAMPFKLPGAGSFVDDGEEEEEEEEEEKETDWKNDRDPSKFMAYILSAYPAGIPAHDGTSTLGCEKAILYLDNLNREISEALRMDRNDDLDIGTLEKIRVNMVKDVVTLKEHVKKLNKRLKKADDSSDIIIKEAGTQKINMVVTPFERAITGIITNAVISAGKPFEDVYDFLKEKYDFTPREELAIMQILLDMGHPIFKDRGTIGETSSDQGGHGVEFIKNYFA